MIDVDLQINKEREVQTSVQIINMVISEIERNQAWLVGETEQKRKEAERKAAELIKQLGQEVSELQGRRDEIQYLEQTEDPIHLIQVSPACKTPPLN